jgi:NAD(P)-dependent dehydrogenase (short-subunit alcohol dehydrogenase family)
VLRVLAKEVGAHGITVNTVAPGMMLSADPTDATDPEISYNKKHGGTPRDKSNYQFRKTVTDYDRKSGIKRLSCTAK